MKLRLLVAVSAVLTFLSCQKSISDNLDEPTSTDLPGTYDFVEMITNRTTIQTDTSNGVITKITMIDTSNTETATGTLQITADKFILLHLDGTGINYHKTIVEIQGQQPQIEEVTEPFGTGDDISYPSDYIKVGKDSVSLTSVRDTEDGPVTETDTQHYRFSGDTLILSSRDYEISYYDNSSYESTSTQRLKFKRKK